MCCPPDSTPKKIMSGTKRENDMSSADSKMKHVTLPVAAAVVFIAIAGVLGTGANAAVIEVTFDTTPGTPTSYTENELTVSTQSSSAERHLHLGDGGNDDRPPGGLRIHGDCCSQPYLFEFSGGAFDFISFDFTGVRDIRDIGSDPITSLFKASNGSTFVLDSSDFLGQILAPDGFTNITSILWSISPGNGFNHQLVIDNFRYNNTPSAVPLPAALPLFGTGLAVMGFIGWQRKRRIAAEAVT